MAKPSAFGVFLVLIACTGIGCNNRLEAQAAAKLPDAPGQQVTAGGSISGVVVDQSGAAVERARVSLVRENSGNSRTIGASQHGEFTFDKVPAGTYRVIVQAIGFATASSDPIVLADGQAFAVPNIALSLAIADTEVNVLANDPVVAEQQMKAEEKQRVLGVIPNFYISYVHDPVPLTTKQKYRLAFRDTFDPVGFIGAGIAAEYEQLNQYFPGYGYGVAGYAKRYAAVYGDGLTSDVLSHAVFPSIFHQDPRYFYQGMGSVKSRLQHAILFAFVTRADDGRNVPNYSYILGDIGSGALSNLYYPHANRGWGLVFLNAGIGVLGQAAGSVAEEFLSKYVTTNVPGKGKP